MPRGGKRAGAGRKKGTAGLSKEIGREILRQEVLKELGPLVRSQIDNAKGLKYLVVRDKKGGKFIRVTEAMAKAKAGDTEETIEVWEKDPSIQAFSDLMNRALDRPAEQPHAVDVNFPQMTEVLARLEAGRKRLMNGKPGTKH